MIIGITGTNGAGKGTVVDYLTSKGFAHYSVRNLLVSEIQKRGMEVDRSSMRLVANELRLTEHPAYVIETLYNEAVLKGGNAVIESVRAIGEAEFLKSKGAILIAVDADREARYKRIMGRGSATDNLDYGTWVMQEEREWHNTAAHDMNVPAVMAMADYTIQNDRSLRELHTQVDTILTTLK